MWLGRWVLVRREEVRGWEEVGVGRFEVEDGVGDIGSIAGLGEEVGIDDWTVGGGRGSAIGYI